MKFAKIFLASFVLLAVASAFIAPKSHIKAPEKKFTTVDNELVWDGSTLGGEFVLGSTSSSALSVAANYASAFDTWGTTSFSAGTDDIAKIRVTYTYTSTDPAPSIQDVATQVFNHYTSSGSPSFFPVNGSGDYVFTFTKSSITITLQVITKPS
jgi:hypothetical protein